MMWQVIKYLFYSLLVVVGAIMALIWLTDDAHKKGRH